MPVNDPAGVLLLALLLDALIGDPDWLYRRTPHPVAIAGWAIGWCDRHLNRDSHAPALRRGFGILTVLGLATAAAAVGMAVAALAASLPGGSVLVALAASSLLAQRSLHEHVAAVAVALNLGGVAEGRSAVARIVGRDVTALDHAGIARAAIESAAENFSDGVVAPAFWFLIGGLPGLMVYKLVNTADSMIGHHSARHHAFGWAAARLDDGLNLIPARLSGLALVLAAAVTAGPGAGKRALHVMWRDAGRHRSPNAGWPEAAMAGALGLALGGPRRYGPDAVAGTWLNGAAPATARAGDIRRALRLLRGSCLILWTLVAALALVPA